MGVTMNYTIVPKPYKMIPEEGCFTLRYDTEIVLSHGCTEQEYGYAGKCPGAFASGAEIA